MSNISEKLLSIQITLKAPKSQFNKFGNYNYRNSEDILEAVKPLCEKHKTVLTLSDQIVNVGERYYVEATATLECIEDNSIKVVKASAREAESQKGMNAAQITGSASSYARKYALNGLFNIDDTKDDDFNNKHGKDSSSTKKKETKQDKEETHETQSFGNVTEEEATELARKKGLGDLLKSLEKPENVEYKVSIMKTICDELKVDKWYDIQFNRDLSYENLIIKVMDTLKKEKELAAAGI